MGVWVVEGVGYFCGRLGLDEVAVRLGVGVGEGHGEEQGEWQGVVGMGKMETLVCRRTRRWSPNMIVCKGIIEVGRK